MKKVIIVLVCLSLVFVAYFFGRKSQEKMTKSEIDTEWSQVEQEWNSMSEKSKYELKELILRLKHKM